MSIKPLILDTTYILPLFGIKIIELSDFKKISGQLWSNGLKGYDLYIPSICLMEVMFKLNGEYRKNKDAGILNRYSIALPSIISSKSVQLINPLLNPETNRIATILRHAGHTDLMDCLIAASAASLKGIFLSEDLELSKIMKVIPETKDVPFWSWKDLIKNEFTK
ncbi:MAG: PIN domain-containing protein [Promethearchaeota archaeon]